MASLASTLNMRAPPLTISTTATTKGADMLSPLLSPMSLASRPKLRISTIHTTGSKDAADFMFLSGSFHPEFFLEHDNGEPSPALVHVSLAELEDTSDVVPVRRGGDLRRSRTVTNQSSSRSLNRPARPTSAGSLKSPLAKTFHPVADSDPSLHVPISALRENTRQLEERLRRLQAESTRLREQNAKLNTEVQQFKETHRPSLSVDTQLKPLPVLQPLPLPVSAARTGRPLALAPAPAPYTPVSMRTSGDLPRPLGSNPISPVSIAPKQQQQQQPKHPQPELTPPPSPDSARTPILLEISTAKTQQIQSISGPLKGTVKRHDVALHGFHQPSTSIPVIPLHEAQLKARTSPHNLPPWPALDRPTTSAGAQMARSAAIPGGWAPMDLQHSPDARRKGSKLGALFSKLRRKS